MFDRKKINTRKNQNTALLLLLFYLLGFQVGTQISQVEKNALPQQELKNIQSHFSLQDLVDIRTASFESVREAQMKIRVGEKELANAYYAPKFGKHIWTARGWAQRITCLSSPDFLKPLNSRMTSRFGRRQNPFGVYTKVHTGLDYRGSIGTPVQAAETGYVKFAKRKGYYGNTIILNHKNGFTTLYAHLTRFAVQPGERVIKGQTLGFVGSTGRVTGPHLHFEVRCNNVPINPIRYLKKSGKKAIVAVMRPKYRPFQSGRQKYPYKKSHYASYKKRGLKKSKTMVQGRKKTTEL